MKEITITCDRCGKVVHGIEEVTNVGKYTGGFYDVSEGYWSEFARWEESLVCDQCMHSCPKYRKIYNYNVATSSAA
jgi:hypothetical protein